MSYGVARTVQASLELAYYRLDVVETSGLDVDGYKVATWDAVRQATVNLDLKSPTRYWVRPSLGLGFGIYEMTETRNESSNFWRHRSVQSGTRLGINWGVGISARLDQRLAIDVGGRYHYSFGRAFLTSDQYMDGARLLSAQAGLSYVVR